MTLAVRKGRVLVDDDDVDTWRSLELRLREEGFGTSMTSDGERTLADAKRGLPDVVLTNLILRSMPGAELYQRLHQVDPGLPVIVLTRVPDAQSVTASLRVEAEDCLIKPLQAAAVLFGVDPTLAGRTAKLEHEELHRTLNERLELSSIGEPEHAEALTQQHAQLDPLLENLSEAVIVDDASGFVLLINEAACTVLEGRGPQNRCRLERPAAWVMPLLAGTR